MPSCSHLSTNERTKIVFSNAPGRLTSTIAGSLCRTSSSVCRELKRNRLPEVHNSRCHADGAHLFRRQRCSVIEHDEALACLFRERVVESLSPEQIAGWLKSGAERGFRTNRREALEPIPQSATRHFGGVSTDTALSLIPGHEHRANFLLDDFQRDIILLGMKSSPIFVRQPAGQWGGQTAILMLKEQLFCVLHFCFPRRTKAGFVRLRGRT